MRWRKAMPQSFVCRIGPWEFEVIANAGGWEAYYHTRGLDNDVCVGTYKSERQAKTYAYRRAKALVERMVREVRDQ